MKKSQCLQTDSLSGNLCQVGLLMVTRYFLRHLLGMVSEPPIHPYLFHLPDIWQVRPMQQLQISELLSGIQNKFATSDLVCKSTFPSTLLFCLKIFCKITYKINCHRCQLQKVLLILSDQAIYLLNDARTFSSDTVTYIMVVSGFSCPA